MEPFLNNLYAEVSFGCVNSVVISAYRLANGDRRIKDGREKQNRPDHRGGSRSRRARRGRIDRFD